MTTKKERARLQEQWKRDRRRMRQNRAEAERLEKKQGYITDEQLEALEDWGVVKMRCGLRVRLRLIPDIE